MSAQWYNHLSTDQTATAFGEYEHHKDQSFDTMRGDSSPGPSAAIATADDHEEGDVDITAGQKMLSAVTGSLFTSLLGMTYPSLAGHFWSYQMPTIVVLWTFTELR